MIDKSLKDASDISIILLRKRNDRTMPPIAAYIEALEKELESYREQLAATQVAQQKVLDYFAVKAPVAANKATTELLPIVTAAAGSQGVMDIIAAAEAKAAARAAAKPFWKFW